MHMYIYVNIYTRQEITYYSNALIWLCSSCCLISLKKSKTSTNEILITAFIYLQYCIKEYFNIIPCNSRHRIKYKIPKIRMVLFNTRAPLESCDINATEKNRCVWFIRWIKRFYTRFKRKRIGSIHVTNDSFNLLPNGYLIL